jgi:hypothetical protein
MEFLWGGPDGRTFPIHRYADLVRAPGAMREFFWNADSDWGTVVLEPKGRLSLPAPDYAARADACRQKTEGPVRLAYTMPFDGFATLVMEDLQGRRVRNLIGMAPRARGNQTDLWDCADENGQFVAPGRYRFRGLLHQGIDPTYEATYGNPGTPPWDTGDGTGAWLSDHTPPRAAAAGGDMMVLGAERAESGFGIIGTDVDGRKKWGDKTLHGLHALAADADYAYVLLASWDVKPTLSRLELKTGRYAPYATATGERLRVPLFKEGATNTWISGFAAGPDHLAVGMKTEDGLRGVRYFDKKTAAVVGELAAPDSHCLAYDPAGALYFWAGSNRVVKVSDGREVSVTVPDPPQWPTGMAVDAAGQWFVADRGRHQVRVYSKNGQFVRAIGRAGGRPPVGQWQADGILNPAAVALDGRGRLWVAEEANSPRRISVWDPADGRLVKDFLGPTGYGGTGANADPDDRTRVFGSGCEWKLDVTNNRAVVVAALGDVSGQLVKKQGREYMMNKDGRLFLRSGYSLKFVAAVGNPCVKDRGQWKDIPLPEAPKGTHGYANFTFVWSDRNDDGQPQAEEVVTGSRWGGWEDLKYPMGTSGYFGSYWLSDDFDICTVAGESYGASGGRGGSYVVKTPLQGWTPGGAPVWDLKNQRRVAEVRWGGCYYLGEKNRNIFGAPITCYGDDGVEQWSYKDNWAGVHASHHAPIPDRDDLLVGTLGTIGRAQTALGTVFAMHSNMGRLYLMTTDGLFVASVFQDCRLGPEPMQNETRKGSPLGGATMGGEWFGGHFFKSTQTGEYFLIAGFTSYHLIKLNGLDTLQPVAGGTVEVTAADLDQAQALARSRAVAAAKQKSLTIARAAAAPALDGKLTGFAKDSFVQWASGPYQIRAALLTDAANLYLACDVSGDNNPMVNGGKDVRQLFATGDSVDLQLATDPRAAADRTEAAVGDLRLLISVFEGKPVAVLYRWKVRADREPVTFTCPWRSHTVDRVEVLADARINIARRGGGYVLEAAVPLAVLGFAPQAGQTYPVDLGVVFSDAKGDNRAARVYWANRATGLVNDVPGEVMASPQMWGKAVVAP